MKPIRLLSRAELLRAMEAASKASSAMVDEMITAGRGHETYRETAGKTDSLSQRYRQAFERDSELLSEHDHRMTWHGKLTPIKAQP